MDDELDPIEAYRLEVEQAREQLLAWIVDRLVPMRNDITGWRLLPRYEGRPIRPP